MSTHIAETLVLGKDAVVAVDPLPPHGTWEEQKAELLASQEAYTRSQGQWEQMIKRRKPIRARNRKK